MTFTSNIPKDIIRKKFDRNLVARVHRRIGRPLVYFGLPGPEILDVIEWKEHLGTVIAVERDEISSHLMRTRAFMTGFSCKAFQILRGDINDIIVGGKDDKGQTPLVDAYDIVNLDYVGGILHKNVMKESKTISALKSLMDSQNKGGRDFGLFLTFNDRNSDEGEFNRVIRKISDDLEDFRINKDDTIDWYLDSRIDYKIKVYLPYVLQPYCRTYRFDCEHMQAVTYKGTGQVRMIHFGILLRHQSEDAGRSHGGQSLVDILNMPMYEVVQGNVSASNLQAPEITIE